MFVIDGKDIQLTHGDSFSFSMTFTGRVLPATAQAVFTLKKRVKDEEALLEKTVPVVENNASVFLFPEDTEPLAYGSYFWDMRVLVPREDGVDVYTPMEYASFQLLEVIGDGI